MTWWIAFTIAVLGWYFTARQNAKNNARSLINQEVKEARSKLHELIVACSSDNKRLPLNSMSEDYIKLQTYIVSVQELDKLYMSYYLPYFQNIRIFKVSLTFIAKLSKHDSAKSMRKFFTYWLVPQSDIFRLDSNSDFNLSMHILNIRQSLTNDMEDDDDSTRIYKLHLEYRKLCIGYPYVN